MSKNLIKGIAVVMLAVMVIVTFMPESKALKITEVDATKLAETAEDTSGAADSVNSIIGAILTITQVIGVGVAVIMLIVLAIKYISAAPGDKADIKKHAIVYVVGAVVLFAASGILQIIKNFASINIKGGTAEGGNGGGTE